MLEFLKRYWKPIAVVVALVAAFGAGRFAGAGKVEVVEKVVTKTVEVEKVVTVTVEKEAKAKTVYIDRVVTKDGEVRERIVEKTVEKKTKDTEAISDARREGYEEGRKSNVTVTDAPRLNVSVLAGVDLQPAWQPITGAGPLALGASVQYRIAGPLTVGVWGVHTGAFGASVGLSF